MNTISCLPRKKRHDWVYIECNKLSTFHWCKNCGCLKETNRRNPGSKITTPTNHKQNKEE